MTVGRVASISRARGADGGGATAVWATAAIAAGAALALADGSLVVLALPQLLSALNTTVEGVAAVIGVYTAVLAAALLPAEALGRRVGSVSLGVGGMALFGAASLVCALARSLPLMLVARGAQAIGAAGALVAAFALLQVYEQRGGAGRMWMLVAIVGTAAGPALGGALTQAFSWSAIFLFQVPVAACGAIACLSRGRGEVARAEPGGAKAEPVGSEGVAPAPLWADRSGADRGGADRGAADRADAPATIAARSDARFGASGERASRRRAGLALALVSAALTAVLFLLVLVLIAGWGYEPLAGAALMSVLPLTALAATRIPGDPRVRAAAGALLVAGGVAALAPMVTASAWWAIAPEVAAGVGTGLVLPALSVSLLPERTPADAARVLTVRHVGITLALVLLAPLIAGRLDNAINVAQQREVAVMLDARIDPLSKVRLVGQLASGVGTDTPRRDIQRSFNTQEASLDPVGRLAVRDVEKRADQTVITAVADTFWPAFLIAGAFALAAAALLLPGALDRRLLAALAVAVAVPLGTAGVALAVRPAPVVLQNPCRAPPPPKAGGIAGSVQDFVLHGLNTAACRLGSSREELVLALADNAAARRYKAKYGVDPRSPLSLAQGLLGSSGAAGSLGSLLRGLIH